MIGGSVAKCCGHWIWIANHSQDQLLHRLSVGAWLGVLALGVRHWWYSAPCSAGMHTLGTSGSRKTQPWHNSVDMTAVLGGERCNSMEQQTFLEENDLHACGTRNNPESFDQNFNIKFLCRNTSLLDYKIKIKVVCSHKGREKKELDVYVNFYYMYNYLMSCL